MSFPSVLFIRPDDQSAAGRAPEPDYFPDLNLDQVVASITAGREEYDLAPFFHARLSSVEAVEYRHEVFGDLEDAALSAGIDEFAAQMRDMRRRLGQAGKLRHRHQRASWFLDAAEIYSDAVAVLARTLEERRLVSRGLRSIRDHAVGYARSGEFETLRADIRRVREALASVRCCLKITDGSVTVTRYEGEADYGAEVLAAFEKFKQAETKSYRVAYHDYVDMNHVEEAILDRVALLYPEAFATLDTFYERHRTYPDRTVEVFDREVQFYLAYRTFIAGLAAAGLPFCHPEVSRAAKRIGGREIFDVALAGKLVKERTQVITNDFHLDGPERVIVVTGPNQGGKTTFARTFGQLHHLAALGCPVPGRQARLSLCDQLFTHFERGENLADLSGKLHDDLVRVHDILERATDASIVIMNEVFTSTTLHDAVTLGTRVLEKIIALDLLCVCVTFVDEFAALGPSTVSMVAAAVPGNPALRTYRIVRRPADGLSYAMAIADKYGITYDRLIERINARAEGRLAS
ncbi:MutS-related protein [Actinoallomurus acaciae]|uniref:DNA mismatch repair proteins mutS family domain-containing protein n=1 Tax=Actinoallomurus acaciae TaxID=502577 RepID=A0ABV5Y929_9ACTN